MPRFGFRVASRIAFLVSAASLAISLTLSFFIALAAAPPLVAAAPPLKLEKGDHICIIGNTLAERMQHYGWLEARIHARHPGLELVVRNLGYSGDEVGGFTEQPDFNKRLRSMSFGTNDEWLSADAPVPQANRLNADAPVAKNRFALTETKADVIFAMFGYGESFEGPAGVDKFKQDVASFIKHARSKKYNGKSPPRIVLFTPIAFENLPDQNLPRGDETNARLELYVRAMQEVAQASDVMLVDLFHPTLAAYKSLRSPATINGVHITEAGDALIGEIAERQLFGETNVKHAVDMAPLYRAVRDKNWYWFNRYRATDGFSTYGDRAFLRFVDGQSNYEVAQRELETLDVLTSNRDRVVWAAAVGRTVKPDDSNLPQFIPVKTNKPGPLPGGKHLFLGGEAAIEKMTVHKEMKVELFATEERFPELINPVQMAFDTKGRLWVAAWPTYPHWKPTEPMDDKLLILEDSDGDGKADKCITFAGDLHNPTGFEFWGGGVLVAQGPDVLFLRDTNGDDRYDVKERVIHGLDTADTHHTANSFTLDPGGSVYFQEGTFHHTQVESPWGKTRRVANGAVFRYEPRTQKFDVYVTYGFANPHGHVFDQWGQDIVVDGTGSNPFHATLFSSRLDYPNKHNNPPQVYQQRTRPCPGMEILSSSHFPEEQRGNLLVGNVIGFQGILQYKLENRDSSLGASEVEPIVYSSDPNFRPADIEVAPDGSIYFTDWQNPIIGHMQHNLRDPSRDRQHGRVYRVRHQTRPLVQPPKIAGATVPALLDVLKHPDDRIRHLARVELSARPTAEVVAALEKWVAALDGPNLASDPRGEHHVTEALWLSQSHNVVNPALLERVLKSTDFQARAAAVRVIASWQDRLPKALDYLRAAAADQAPRVRLQAIWSASFLTQPEAIEVLLIAGEQPSDQYIQFLSNEVVRTLQPLVDKAKTDGRKLAFKSEAGARYYLKNLSNEQLLAEPRSRMVAIEMLYRPGLRDEHRREAVRELAKVDGKTELQVVMDAIHALDRRATGIDVGVVFDLVRQLTGRRAAELASARAELEKLATSAKQAIFRQIGFVSLISVDGGVDKAWGLATSDPARLVDFVNAVPMISDASVRAGVFEQILPLLKQLPAPLHDKVSDRKGTYGRYVRIELPRRGTLTLAEVEVLSGGDNVARRGRATQKNTAHGGDASRAIDGKRSGSYGDGGQTHTEEETTNPFWEVDLTDELPIDQIAVFNRTDGDLGNRLDGFTIRVLDSGRGEVWKQEKVAAPKPSVQFQLEGGGPVALVRRAAMNALTTMRGQETTVFAALAPFVKDDTERAYAVRALQRLPKATWPADQAPELLATLTAAVRKTAAKDRTSPTALDALEFADALAGLLPADAAKKSRAELAELGVRVIRIGTVFERMSYDKEVIVVRAGKPVEFILDNNDLMPHNLAITLPGALEEIGLLGEATAQQPSAGERGYIPQSSKILLASRLLQPRESQKLSFVAPREPGVYPYVCTYPGHWRRMYGALYVVEDLDEYQANPEAYLAANKIDVKDALLKDRRPRTQWKLEDLADIMKEMSEHGGRNFGNGKQLFTVASCVACHKLGGVGNEIGPDLAKLDEKWQPLDIVKEILDPSLKINEKYQTYVFELNSGKTITGLILEEKPDQVKVIENPLAKTAPVMIKKSDIAERTKSPTSLMPKGLLDKLTRDEILDLIAYLAARGDKSHALFGGDGHDHHKH